MFFRLSSSFHDLFLIDLAGETFFNYGGDTFESGSSFTRYHRHIPQGRGVVRFIGPTSFANRKWVSLELYEPDGRNHGSVNGTHYFTRKTNYGVFIRQSQINGVHGSELDASPSTVRICCQVERYVN